MERGSGTSSGFALIISIVISLAMPVRVGLAQEWAGAPGAFAKAQALIGPDGATVARGSLGTDPSGAQAMSVPTNASKRQYLLFQVFLGGPDPRTGVFTTDRTKADHRAVVHRIDRALRPSRSDPNRILGFSIGPIALDQGERAARQVIRDAFEIAADTDMALALHLDDYMFWGNARDRNGQRLADDPANVEWVDWSGTPATHMEIEWLPGVKLPPQMCYESPAMRSLARWWTRDVVGAEIDRQVSILKAAGKEYLFAGVIVGWESNLEHGYCSLTQMGYGAGNPPTDFDYARATVVQHHIARWAKGINDAGIDKAKIFSHIALITKRAYEMLKRRHRMDEIRKMRQSAAFRALWAAFNDYSNPGFSAYPESGLFAEIHDALAKRGNPPWAMAEGTNFLPPEGGAGNVRGRSTIDWETYLARSFNHGAKIVNIFGGFQGNFGPYTTATESGEAIAAYRKFLRGETLLESGIERSAPASNGGDLAERIGGLPDRVRHYARNGGDMTSLEIRLKKLDRHMRNGDLNGAVLVLDEIDAILGR